MFKDYVIFERASHLEYKPVSNPKFRVQIYEVYHSRFRTNSEIKLAIL